MKKVFLSLAVVAVLTIVSCKKSDAAAEETMTTDSTAVEVVDSVAVDTTALAVDSAAVVTETPAE
ncbi:hypothetical protein [Flavobacterium sp. ACAM 123]|jgi:hypothetical protein|uniref:hypothetical protein n=1 Tax=Flavobacterium sp. ACAM 123 TaxID=1189620 RepID=UPI00031B90B5|nr:hypothetical protein [Flavobacterium sp. ACAM 123]